MLASYKQDNTLYYALGGLFAGIVTDVVFLRKWIKMAFDLPVWILAGIYLFYSICIYGFFMGFPVFNLLMGIIAGYYYGKRIVYRSIPHTVRSDIIKQVALFSGLIMLFFCSVTGTIAVIDDYTGPDLQSMLGLKFEITKAMILGAALIGTIIL